MAMSTSTLAIIPLSNILTEIFLDHFINILLTYSNKMSLLKKVHKF